MSLRTKPLEMILVMGDEKYLTYVNHLLSSTNAMDLLDKLDDQLLAMVDTRAAEVERIGKLNQKAFENVREGRLRISLLAYNYNTRMIASICQDQIPESIVLFLEGLGFCRENRQYAAGKSLSHNIFRLINSGKVSHDEAPALLERIFEFYKTLEKHSDAIEALCSAAMYFAEASAFQSAYRALDDAQQIAIANRSPRSQLQILETQGTVALMEGDLKCSEAEYSKALSIYATLGEKAPFGLMANIALVQLRRRHYARARDIYLKLLQDYSEEDNAGALRQVRINLLVCYRQLRDPAASDAVMHKVEEDLKYCELEEGIEAKLVLAKSYSWMKNPSKGTEFLKAACIDVQRQIDRFHRLHYRRGIREHYVSRIKSLLTGIPRSGKPIDILNALVFCSSNSLLDWLAALQWIDSVLKSTIVPNSTKEELIRKREELIRFGTPFVYGFREKYDDPFEFPISKIKVEFGEKMAAHFDYSLPWREFNYLTSSICESHSFSPPFERASIQSRVDFVTGRLLTGSALLFAFACKSACMLVLLTKDRYFASKIPVKQLMQFQMSLFSYQHGEESRNSFHHHLVQLEADLKPALTAIIRILEDNPIRECVFISDYLTEALPILPPIIASEPLRARIKTSDFVFRSCPALWDEQYTSTLSGPLLFVSNSGEQLELTEAEKTLVKNAFVGQTFHDIDLRSQKIDFTSPPASSAKLLHLSTHNSPANVFSDPFFVSTREEGVWLESVQREAHRLNLELVVLNGCNTGTTSNWNYFKTFSTSEKIGLSSIFLLNRRSVLVATQWNEPELAAYIFSSLFYKRLAAPLNAARAFILALVDLHELNHEAAILLLEQIPEETIKAQSLATLKRSKALFPFRNSYFLGIFQFHSLLNS